MKPTASSPVSSTVAAGLVHVTSPSGHRAAYQDLFQRLFGLQPTEGRISAALFGRMVKTPRLLFATLDDDLRGFVLVALTRAMIGRRTVGLFLRPQSCLTPGWRALVKRWLFAVLRRVPGASIVSIIPFSLQPRIARVASHWVHDPQLWDLTDLPPAADPAIMASVCALAGGRRVVVFLGRVSAIKGFPFLVQLFEARPGPLTDCLLVVAGLVDEDCREAADRVAAAGAVVWNRRLTDAEMAGLYAVGDLIWACYDPSYDQASGIFGRAVQTGRTAIVRQGSLIEKYADLLNMPVVRLDASVGVNTMDALEPGPALSASLPKRSEFFRGWREEFIETLDSRLSGKTR